MRARSRVLQRWRRLMYEGFPSNFIFPPNFIICLFCFQFVIFGTLGFVISYLSLTVVA